MNNLGLLCENVWPGSQGIIDEMGDKTAVATEILIADYNIFEKELQLPEPYRYETYICTKLEHDAENYDAYWYHPDHLGSSSYITNTSGEVSQHMEYFPFGELLVDEHLNSYNSPYKFSALELDSETGNYYASKRYYNPKWSIWLSPDILATEFPSWSPYSYSFQNPVKYTDNTGMAPELANKPLDWYKNKKGEIVWFDNTAESFTNEQGTWTNVGANEQEVKQNLNIPQDRNVSWNTVEGVRLGASDKMGRRGGALGVTVLNNDARISFDLNIENTGRFGSLIDGKSTITGVNVSMQLSSGTSAPGVQLTHIGGNFGLRKWTTMGKINTITSSIFSPLSYPTLSPNSTHAVGRATMHIPLFQYRGMSRNFSQTPNFNLGINSTAGFRMQTSPNWNKPTLSNRFFNTSTNFRF